MTELADIDISFDKATFRRRLLHWHDQHREPHPWRLRFEKGQDPYVVWLSEVMLQQTVIKAVLPAYERFLELFPTVQDLAKADTEQVRQACRGLGYYRRFNFLHQAARLLSDAAGEGRILWPTTRDDWQKLPGIGSYTSAAISSICLNEPCAVVDGNVERVICRLLNIQLPVNLPKLKPHYQRWAQDLLEVALPGRFNEALMELGQKICRPQQPKCAVCPVAESCEAHRCSTTAVAPQPKIALKSIETIQLGVIIPTYKHQIGLSQRPSSARFLKETWGWLTGSIDDKHLTLDGAEGTKHDLRSAMTLGHFRHSITHHRITGVVLTQEFSSEPPSTLPIKWVNEDELESALVASFDIKAFKLWRKHARSKIKA